MKKILNALKTVAAITVLTTAFLACDKDFTSIGTDVIGPDNFGTNNVSYPVITYNKRLENLFPVQTNNLSSNLLGIYDDAIYGKTTANFVSQVALSIIDPDFGDNTVLDSVILTIPYYSHQDQNNLTNETTGRTNFILDSVFGNPEVPMKLSLYRNNYFLRNFDPETEFEGSQNYYSNGGTSTSQNINSQLEFELIQEISLFDIIDQQIILTQLDDEGETEETGRLTPSIRISLDKAYWQALIINKEGEPELSNVSNFQNYFRGIYFKIEEVAGSGGAMAMLDFTSVSTNITMHYTKDPFLDTATEQVKSTFPITFTGNKVNIFENDPANTVIEDADALVNTTDGDEKLYLKGGEGSLALIKLFEAENIDDDDSFDNTFETFKKEFVNVDADGNYVSSKRLINEAFLIFYEDETLVTEENHKYDRLYLFDSKNNLPVIDYLFDGTTNTTTPLYSKIIYSTNRYSDAAENNKFKIRITEHLKNLILRDSTNNNLGLVLTTNINSIQNKNILGATSDDDLTKVPSGAVLSPKGTVLYGNNTTNTNKKVKLQIYYTEPNN